MTDTEPTGTEGGPPAHRIHRATPGGSDDDARHPARRLRRALAISDSVSPGMPLAGGKVEAPRRRVAALKEIRGQEREVATQRVGRDPVESRGLIPSERRTHRRRFGQDVAAVSSKG